jgi:DNA-binding response OmpR family regulator
MRLLVVGDNTLAAGQLRRALREAGYAVDVVHDGDVGFARLLDDAYDAAIVVFMLPDRSSISFVQAVREHGSALPIVMITANEARSNIIRALDAGVDDCLTLPYSVDELLARVRALLRRGKAGSSTDLTVGDVVVDRLKREVRVRERPVRVTPKEFALLEYLLLNSGRVVTRSALLEQVWDIHFDASSNVVDVHVGRLRSKLRRNGARVALETVRGAGYLIRDSARVS